MRNVYGVLIAVALSGASVGLHRGEVFAADAGAYTIATPLKWLPGGPRERKALSNSLARDIVVSDFQSTFVDLDDDGQAELVVQSTSSQFCTSSGCTTRIIQRINGKPTLIFDGAMPDALGVTVQKKGAYRLLAVLDGKGGIARSDRKGSDFEAGGQWVYAMQAPAGQSPSAGASAAAQPPSAPPPTQPQPQAKATAAAGVGPETTGASAAAGTESRPGSGPDVIGLRIGMSPAPAVEILRKRFGIAPTVSRTQLIVSGSNGNVLKVPDWDFVDRVSLQQINPSDPAAGTTLLNLSFGGPTGRERLMFVDRRVGIGAPDRPTFEAFIASLLEKYGPPSSRFPPNASMPNFLSWGFDASGKLLRNEVLEGKTGGGCSYGTGSGFVWSVQTQVKEKTVQDCGEFLLHVYDLQFADGRPDPKGLVSSYRIALVGMKATYEIWQLSQEAIRQAYDADRNAATQAGAKKKPDL